MTDALAQHTPPHGGALAACCALALLGGCNTTPEAYELANMRGHNVLPRSTPASFVAAFDRYCADPSAVPAALENALQDADYVPLRTGKSGLNGFVVDDNRPAVFINGGPRLRHCAVGAKSRSGQTARVVSFVAERFPDASPIDTTGFGENTERAWATEDGRSIIYTYRDGALRQPSLFIFGKMEPGDRVLH